MLEGNDEFLMLRALELAARGLGAVEPNPMVGAIVCLDGKIVGEGFHRKFGGPHAEVVALRAAGEWARGGTLYVTLEPCCHFGKTPPCTDAIIAAGIQRVVCATRDPFSQVNGKGLAALRKHGIKVKVGGEGVAARELNRAFMKRVTQRKPYVIAKWAQTLDGAVATASGESKWISSAASRQLVHVLRGRVDSILIGLGTALHDDPLLTARPAHKADIKRIALRVVLDSQCNLPVNSQLVHTAKKFPLLVACAERLTPAAKRQCAALVRKGAEILAVPVGARGRPGIGKLLAELNGLGHTNTLVEGGPHVMGSLIEAGEIDEAHIFMAPKLIPGRHAIRPIWGADLSRLGQSPQFEIEEVNDSGGDVYVIARKRVSEKSRKHSA